MSECEFDKRAVRYLNDPHQLLVKSQDINEALDDFPKNLLDLSLNPNYKPIEEWLTKWFGGST